ncbi:hypothetical protein [Microvirga calopogonii]|uniref:hypothetical protein n=1 Tax=Microvirga calopogonii TaxID=2078013 RepID=UPI000E0D84F3|nr:hypothetical protein [Microvirga calopogonii]
MSNLDEKRPDGWSASPLTEFYDTLFSNTLASFNNLPAERRKLEAVDNIFNSLLQDFIDPEHILPALLILRSIGAYRVASLLSMTAPTDAYVSMRSCLEYAGYAHLLKANPELNETWLNREDNENTRKEARKAFTGGAMLTAIKDADRDLGRIYKYLYEWTISHGAHPNERALMSSLKIIKEQATGKTHLQVLLLPEGGVVTQSAMKTCAQIGIAVLRAAALIFPSRFEELGLNAAIKEASNGL